jgi:hypothetical protein
VWTFFASFTGLTFNSTMVLGVTAAAVRLRLAEQKLTRHFEPTATAQSEATETAQSETTATVQSEPTATEQSEPISCSVQAVRPKGLFKNMPAPGTPEYRAMLSIKPSLDLRGVRRPKPKPQETESDRANARRHRLEELKRIKEAIKEADGAEDFQTADRLSTELKQLQEAAAAAAAEDAKAAAEKAAAEKAAAEKAAAAKAKTDWCENNKWVLGGGLIAATSPRHVAGGKTNLDRIGGRSQRLLQAGETTLEALRAEWEERIAHHEPSPPPSPKRGPTFSKPIGQMMGVDARIAQMGQEARQKRELLEQAAVLEKLTEESSRQALASRVAEMQERLARRQALIRKQSERRNAEWVAARLRTGLTAVLDRSDPLTRRAIALTNHAHLLQDHLVPPFDGLAAHAPPLTRRPESARRHGAPRTGHRHGTPWERVVELSAAPGALGTAGRQSSHWPHRAPPEPPLTQDAALATALAMRPSSAPPPPHAPSDACASAGQGQGQGQGPGQPPPMLPDVVLPSASSTKLAGAAGRARPATATMVPQAQRPLWRHSGVARGRRAQSARGIPAKYDLTGR